MPNDVAHLLKTFLNQGIWHEHTPYEKKKAELSKQ